MVLRRSLAELQGETLVEKRSAVVLVAGHPFDGHLHLAASADLLGETDLPFEVAYIDFKDVIVVFMSLLGCAHLPFQACPLREGEAECGRVGAELIWTQVVDVPAGIHFGCGCNLEEPVAERLDSGLPADVGLRLCKK